MAVFSGHERGAASPVFGNANWVSLGGLPGTDGYVSAMAVNSSAGLVYIGGSFSAVGTVAASNIAMWNGTNWSALGSGVSGKVTALGLGAGGTLYVGGNFFSAGGVSAINTAMWNGYNWSSLGGAVGGEEGGVSALAVQSYYTGDRVYAAGGSEVAEWTRGAWSTLGTGINSVDALAVDGYGNLYAGGCFTSAGGTAANYIAEWNGSSWSALGAGLVWGQNQDQCPVAALVGALSDGVYVGGNFDSAGGVEATNIAYWDGNSWYALGTGLQYYDSPGDPKALALDNANNLYVGGSITSAGGVPALNIAKWVGNVGYWTNLGPEINGFVDALALDGPTNLVAYDSSNEILEWNGNSWSALNSGSNFGLSSVVDALAADASGHLYAGGGFTSAGSAPANYVATWNGSAWSALGMGMNSTVYALASDSGSNLYAGGLFTKAGSVTANYVAQWNGSAWYALGSGMGGVSPNVNALVLDSVGEVYAAGHFTTAGGIPATNIAKWNGSAWFAVGLGIGGSSSLVRALASDGAGNLYAGGTFSSAGGTPATNVAQWNGANWSALGTGIAGAGGPQVYALITDGASNLYAGGSFTTAGGIAATNIAKWNGSVWAPLGPGIRGIVNALMLDGAGNLYAGGSFTTAGGVPANFIAQWNGNVWTALGSGMNNTVSALALGSNGYLYAGGSFTTAGVKVSAYVAQANILPVIFKTSRNLGGSLTLNLLTAPNTSSRILATTNLAPPLLWQPIYTNVAPSNGSWQFTDTNASLFPARLYRSVTP